MKKEDSVETDANSRTHADPYILKSTTSTETIDISNFFVSNVTSSGSFDFREIKNITFGKLLESIPIPTMLIDTSHEIVYGNEAFAKIGVNLADLVGMSFETCFPGPGESQRALSVLKQVFSERKTEVFEGLLQISGSILWGRLNLRAVRFGSKRSVLAIIEDLTQEKRQLIANRKYQQLVEVFPIGIAEFSCAPPVAVDKAPNEFLQAMSAAKLVGGNVQFAKIHGYTSVGGLTGARMGDLFKFSPAFKHLSHRWIKEGFPVRTFETKETGTSVTLHYENTLVANIRNGYVLGFWMMRQNVTERKLAEQALRRSRERLEERVAERTEELINANKHLAREVGERENAEKELARMVQELQEALAKVKTLSGLLPICASCKKIRDDKGYWTQVEVYVSRHSDASFTHSICPECAAKLYPEFYSDGSI